MEKHDSSVLIVPRWRKEIESLLLIERTDTDSGYSMREHVH